MAQLHLILGPVGAGKSTFAQQLAEERRAVRLTLDDWMTRLFSPDRPASGVMEWYVERAGRCIDQIWRIAGGLLSVGTDAILEIGLIRRDDRERLFERVDAAGHALTVYVLDAPREVRRERVERRNRDQGATFSMVVPPHFFELASDLWQPLDDDECEGRDVRFVSGAPAGAE
ncbi:MAG: ATP-binding protein [Deltaproteobacteria bacterium]|nr:ATP-binding protein [Deltaproteobacteria bacterium]